MGVKGGGLGSGEHAERRGVSAGQGRGSQPHSTSCSSRLGPRFSENREPIGKRNRLGGLQGRCKLTSAHVHAPRSFSVQTPPGLHTCCRGPAWLRSEDSGRSPHGSGRVSVGRGWRAGSCPFHPRAPSSGLGRALLGAQDTGGRAPAGGHLTQRPGFLPASSACGAPRGHSDAQHGDDQACRQRDRHRDTHASAPLPAGRGRWHLLCSFGVPVLLPGPRPSEPAAPGSREPRSPQPRPPPRGPGSQGETASQRL